MPTFYSTPPEAVWKTSATASVDRSNVTRAREEEHRSDPFELEEESPGRAMRRSRFNALSPSEKRAFATGEGNRVVDDPEED